jgi:WD40 repeat protein
MHCWKEYILIGSDERGADTNTTHYHPSVDKSALRESIADISAISLNQSSCWLVGTASSSGVLLVLSNVSYNQNDGIGSQCQVHIRQIASHAAASIQIIRQCNECWIFVGSASPRHNKIWVYTLPMVTSLVTNYDNAATNDVDGDTDSWAVFPRVTVNEPQYQGCLLGHQDWITCFAWLDHIHTATVDGEKREGLLATSGHDAKIRLWKFTSLKGGNTDNYDNVQDISDDDESNNSSEEDEANIDDLEEGEARLIIHHSSNNSYDSTVVSLEALLLGHEEAITSLSWRHGHKSSQKPCLLSSSMDRSILLWMEQEYEQQNVSLGVWVPISRVGSAGGILGGSIGASLMGFVDAAFSPGSGRIVGHGYGGSLHFWSRVIDEEDGGNNPAIEGGHENQEGGEDELLSTRWLADPCITGHFRPVQDLAWDPNGKYLLTVGLDQTTRLWAQVPTDAVSSYSSLRWMEVGRPQVHGYDLTSIVCIGGLESEDGEPRHRFVSGADEKVLRVFDAPASTLRLLSSLKRTCDFVRDEDPAPWRVERAFLPSLGLSNKATADPEQESTKYAGPLNDDNFVNSLNTVEYKHGNRVKLPSERDLGVTTLWPETRKLFGHDSELVCLDACRAQEGSNFPTLVASSCKARNDVASAAIRLWNVRLGKCVSVLKVSAVTKCAFSFSVIEKSDARYLYLIST